MLHKLIRRSALRDIPIRLSANLSSMIYELECPMDKLIGFPSHRPPRATSTSREILKKYAMRLLGVGPRLIRDTKQICSCFRAL